MTCGIRCEQNTANCSQESPCHGTSKLGTHHSFNLSFARNGDVSLSFHGVAAGYPAETRIELAFSVFVVGREAVAVDEMRRITNGDFQMIMLEHGAADFVFIADIFSRLDRISDFQAGFAGDGVKDDMGIIRPFAVPMRYPDKVVVAERGGAARLLLIISVADRDCGPAPSTA